MNKAQACLHESSSEQSDRWCLSELFIYLQSACDREGLKGRCREEVCCVWGLVFRLSRSTVKFPLIGFMCRIQRGTLIIV